MTTSTNKLNHYSAGGSHLLLVLIVSSILTLIVFSIMLLALLDTRQAAVTDYTQQAYFAAEGSMFETVQDIKQNFNYWINQTQTAPYTDSYTINDSFIQRTISYNPTTNQIDIVINTETKGVRKKLVGNYKPQEDETPTLDVVLLIDKSSSMQATNPSTGKSSLDYAKDAARSFINVIDDRAQQQGISRSRIGIIAFHHYADGDGKSSDLPLALTSSSETDIFNEKIDSLTVANNNQGTNIAEGLRQAQLMLTADANRLSVGKAIVLLSDGVPQFAEHDFGDQQGECSFNNSDPNNSLACAPNACANPTSIFQPTDASSTNIGNCCTDRAVTRANLIKNDIVNIAIFSISLTANYDTSSSYCINSLGLTSAIDSTKKLGNYTMLRISGTKTDQPPDSIDQLDDYLYFRQTADATALDQIFSDIASRITSPAFFQYFEQAPDSP